MPATHHSVFNRPDALPVAQPTFLPPNQQRQSSEGTSESHSNTTNSTIILTVIKRYNAHHQT